MKVKGKGEQTVFVCLALSTLVGALVRLLGAVADILRMILQITLA